MLTPDFFAVRALEGVELVGEERNILKDIRKEMDNGETEETLAKAVKELRKTSAHSVRSAEWSESDGLLHFCGKIYVPDSAELRRRIVSLCHDTKIVGHCGRWKTLELVYWWPQMSWYLITSENMSPLAICVYIRKHPANHRWVNSTLFRFRTILGM